MKNLEFISAVTCTAMVFINGDDERNEVEVEVEDQNKTEAGHSTYLTQNQCNRPDQYIERQHDTRSAGRRKSGPGQSAQADSIRMVELANVANNDNRTVRFQNETSRQRERLSTRLKPNSLGSFDRASTGEGRAGNINLE